MKDGLTAHELEVLASMEKVVFEDRTLTDDGQDKLARLADNFLVADYAARIRALHRRVGQLEHQLRIERVKEIRRGAAH